MPSIGSLCVGSFYIFIFSILQPLSWKVTFSGTQKPTPPTVLNLQVSDWVHREEETCAYYHLSQLTYKLVILFFLFFKVAYFVKKNYALFKKFSKFIIHFFSKRDNLALYMCIKCNDNFKFTISLKSYDE